MKMLHLSELCRETEKSFQIPDLEIIVFEDRQIHPSLVGMIDSMTLTRDNIMVGHIHFHGRGQR